MEINGKVINEKEELLNLIREGVNPLEYIKDERDIDFVCHSLVIERKDEDTFWEDSAENLLRAILYYVVFTDNEEKNLARCKSIVEIGLNEAEGKDKIADMFEKEERAKVLYVPINIASDKTCRSIFETLENRLARVC